MQRFREQRSVFAFFLCIVTMLCTSVRPTRGAEPVTLAIPGGVANWAVQSETGRVFASMQGGSQVVEYAPNGREVRRFEVGQDPTEMIFKKDLLIVANTTPPSLSVIDLRKNVVKGEVQMLGNGPYGLFASKVDNDFVYCFANPTTRWNEARVFQIDLAKLAIRKERLTNTWRAGGTRNVLMSSDGQWIVSDKRAVSHPSGAFLMRVNEDEFTFGEVFALNDSFGPISGDFLGRYWMLGNQLFPIDLQGVVRTFAGQSASIHPKYDLVVSLRDRELILERFSNATEISKFNLAPSAPPEPVDPKNRNARPTRFDTVIQFDLVNNLVFVGERTQATWVPLEPQSGNLDLQTLIVAPSSISAETKSTLHVPVRVTNQEMRGDLKVTIAKGPAWARLEELDLVLTTGDSDAGNSHVLLTLTDKAGKELDRVSVLVRVGLPRINIGTEARGMEISRGGKFALLWGNSPGQEGRHPAQSGSDDLIVLDLETMKILSRKTLPQGVRYATIDDQYIYLSPISASVVYRFDHKFENGQRHFLPFSPDGMTKIDNDHLLLYGQSLRMLDIHGMKSQPNPTHWKSEHGNRSIFLLTPRLLSVGSFVMDTETKKSVRILNVQKMPSVLTNQRELFHAPQVDAPIDWGRRIREQSLTNYGGNRIATLPGYVGTGISKSYPVAVGISDISMVDTGATTAIKLDFLNLIDGTVVQTMTIDKEVATSVRLASTYMRQSPIVAEADFFYIIHGSDILRAQIPEKTRDALSVPTHFRIPQQTQIEVAGRVTFPLEVGGMTEGVSFQMQLEYPFVTLDEKLGRLTVETQQLWSTFMQELTKNGKNLSTRFGEDIFSKEVNATAYKEATGEELSQDKFSICLPISVFLQDAQGIEDRVQFCVLVVGPRKDVDNALETFESNMKAAQAERRKQVEREQAEHERQQQMLQRQGNEANSRDLESRLNAMEGRMRRLEAALEGLLKQQDQK